MSGQSEGVELDLSSVNGGPADASGVAHAAELLAFTEAAMGVDDAALAYYDDTENRWQLEPAGYRFEAGESSRSLPLTETWRFDGTRWEKS